MPTSVRLLLDLSAAFDTVDHEVLLNVLGRWFAVYGVPPAWFQSNLTDSAQTFRTASQDSSAFYTWLLRTAGLCFWPCGIYVVILTPITLYKKWPRRETPWALGLHYNAEWTVGLSLQWVPWAGCRLVILQLGDFLGEYDFKRFKNPFRHFQGDMDSCVVDTLVEIGHQKVDEISSGFGDKINPRLHCIRPSPHFAPPHWADLAQSFLNVVAPWPVHV